MQQGWLASTPPADAFSEGVLLKIDTAIICLRDIIQIHLETHSSDSVHSKRSQYRSAVYTLNEQDADKVRHLISTLNFVRDKKIITQVLPLKCFKAQPKTAYIDYFYKRPEKPFCQAYISPKLKKLVEKHGELVKHSKLTKLNMYVTNNKGVRKQDVDCREDQ